MQFAMRARKNVVVVGEDKGFKGREDEPDFLTKDQWLNDKGGLDEWALARISGWATLTHFNHATAR